MKKLLWLMIFCGAMPLSMTAQDDDMYFVPTKENKAKEAATYGMPSNTYYSGSNRSVDEYNRRIYTTVTPIDSLGNDIIDFSAERGVYPADSLVASSGDYKLTKHMTRFDDYTPSQAYWEGFRDGRWSSPWYYSYYSWYDPWYWDSWYYGPYYSTHWWSWPSSWYYSGWYYPRHYGWYYHHRPYRYYAHHYYAPGAGRHVSYGGPRGFSGGGRHSYSAGTFGGSRVGGGNSGGTRSYNPGRSSSQSNSFGNFGGSRGGGGSFGGGSRGGGGGGRSGGGGAGRFGGGR